MELDNKAMELSGLPIGPFPKPEDLGIRLSQWILLPEVEALGFTQEELVVILADWLRLFEGSVEESIQKVRQLFLSQFQGAITSVAKLAPEDETIEAVTVNGIEKHVKSMEERAAEVLALFCALSAYLSCVEREGPDKANTYSFFVHETLSIQLPACIFKLPELLTTLQHQTPARFTKRLKQTSGGVVSLRRFEGLSLKDGIEKVKECLEDPSLPSPKDIGYVNAGRIAKTGEDDSPNLHDGGFYLEALLTSLLLGREDFISGCVNVRIAQDEGLHVMDGKYAELGGEQGIAESLAQDYLNRRSQAIIKASLTTGEAFARAEEALNTLEPMMTRFKKESTIELEETETLRRLGRPASLDKEIEGEDGETTTLANMMPATADLEEALPILFEWLERLEPEDSELFMGVFFDGRELQEVAIERGWDYDRAQKRVWRLHKEIEGILTQMDH